MPPMNAMSSRPPVIDDEQSQDQAPIAAAAAAPPAAMPQNGSIQSGRKYPAQFAQQIDPNNQIQAMLLDRMDALTQQDVMALANDPAAIEAMKKIMPEIGFVLDALEQKGHPWQSANGAPVAAVAAGGAGDGNPEVEEDDEQPEAPEPPEGATPLRPAGLRPKTKLGQY